MVIGMAFSGVLTGLIAALLAVSVGHAAAVVALAYCLSGIGGSALFLAAAMCRCAGPFLSRSARE